MSVRHLNVDELFTSFRDELSLRWLGGLDGGHRRLTREGRPGQRSRLLGPLNFNSPNRIQLLGTSETRLVGGPAGVDPTRFEYDLADTCEMMVISNDQEAPPALV